MIKGLYIHIPFCNNICNYCDFPKKLIKFSDVSAYLTALFFELETYKSLGLFVGIETIYIGGGTPSSLDIEDVDMLLSKVVELVEVSNVKEFSIECNPDDVNDELVSVLVSKGVNRISLGVQTFNSKLLKLLGRTHNENTVLKAISCIKKKGIDNISIDLIHSIPTQTLSDLKYDVELAVKLGLKHISYYNLILEPNTVFYKMKKNKEIDLIDNDVEMSFYNFVEEILVKFGFNKYETSNFSLEGYESAHNKVYWKNERYIGVGVGAYSYVDNYRYGNTKVVKEYISVFDCVKKYEASKTFIFNSKSVYDVEKIMKEDNIAYHMILGLRLTKGIHISDFKKKFNLDLMEKFGLVIEKWIRAGMLEVVDGFLRLTRVGSLLANEVLEDFVN